LSFAFHVGDLAGFVKLDQAQPSLSTWFAFDVAST
jgi:hypothetical protein